GDINGDGFDDLIVAATAINGGEAYVVFGGAFGAGTTPVITTGTGAAEILIGDLGDDMLTGNGGADVLRSGAGDDVLGVSDLGFARIDGGTGTDTLRIDGSGITLDLTQIGPAMITDIERIDLTGSGANALTLSQLNVYDLTSERTNGTAVLTVAGAPDDSVTLTDAGWVNVGSVIEDGVTFDRYVFGNAEVRIQQGMTVNVDNAPVANADLNTIAEDTTSAGLTFVIGNVIAGDANGGVADTDLDGDPLSVSDVDG
ncbi:unnamed protein product, partial [marine sediment metagenome]